MTNIRMIKAEKNNVRRLWHISRNEAFCPHYWLLDYKQNRNRGLSITHSLKCTDLDVSGK